MVHLWTKSIESFGEQVHYAYFGQFGRQEIELPLIGISFHSKA